MNINKRSGNPTIDRKDYYFKKKWEETIDKDFVQTVFAPYPALVRKDNVDGQRSWEPYYGGQYDQAKYDLVKDMWDHEHCSICNFKITEGNTYWFNEDSIRLLCDECYEFYKRS